MLLFLSDEFPVYSSVNLFVNDAKNMKLDGENIGF